MHLCIYEVVDAIKGAPDLCVENHFGYGTHAGCPRIRALLEQYSVRATMICCARDKFVASRDHYEPIEPPGGEVAVVFSGHGVEIEAGNNFIPRDAPAVGTGEARRDASKTSR
jgi:hypothetical protein